MTRKTTKFLLIMGLVLTTGLLLAACQGAAT